MAAGVAAAVLLLVVVSSLGHDPANDRSEHRSSEGIPIPKSLPQKTAFVVLFKDFKDPALQKQIDSLYEALDSLQRS